MPATISPVLPSALTKAVALRRCGPCRLQSGRRRAALQQRDEIVAGRPRGLAVHPGSEVTATTICMSPVPNLSDSSCEACQDCDVGSRKPPLDRLLVTGMPKIAAPTMISSATAMIRRGARDGQ